MSKFIAEIEENSSGNEELANLIRSLGVSCEVVQSSEISCFLSSFGTNIAICHNVADLKNYVENYDIVIIVAKTTSSIELLSWLNSTSQEPYFESRKTLAKKLKSLNT